MSKNAKVFKKLSVADRNAVIIGLNLDDSVAAKELGITVEEVTTARKDVAATSNFDVSPFAAHFQKPTTSDDAGSATTVARPVKKRGPQGSRIVDAFNAVTGTPVPLATFANKHHVSENCLRQPKRFYKGTDVKICVRKHKDHDGQVCIWSEPVEETVATS